MNIIINYIASCTNCGDTYDLQEAIKNFQEYDFSLPLKECFMNKAQEQLQFLVNETKCLKCNCMYKPIDKFKKVSMNKFVFEAFKNCKGH